MHVRRPLAFALAVALGAGVAFALTSDGLAATRDAPAVTWVEMMRYATPPGLRGLIEVLGQIDWTELARDVVALPHRLVDGGGGGLA